MGLPGTERGNGTAWYWTWEWDCLVLDMGMGLPGTGPGNGTAWYWTWEWDCLVLDVGMGLLGTGRRNGTAGMEWVGSPACARLRAQRRRYEAVLEMVPRQYSMVWMDWWTKISPTSNCGEEGRGGEKGEERRGGEIQIQILYTVHVHACTGTCTCMYRYMYNSNCSPPITWLSPVLPRPSCRPAALRRGAIPRPHLPHSSRCRLDDTHPEDMERKRERERERGLSHVH